MEEERELVGNIAGCIVTIVGAKFKKRFKQYTASVHNLP